MTADDFRARKRLRQLNTCVHHVGLFPALNDLRESAAAPAACKKGFVYEEMKIQTDRGVVVPCVRVPPYGEPHAPECDYYEPQTAAQLDEDDSRFARAAALIGRDLSPCCEAAIDHSRALQTGRMRGHGGHYCSACSKLVMWV